MLYTIFNGQHDINLIDEPDKLPERHDLVWCRELIPQVYKRVKSVALQLKKKRRPLRATVPHLPLTYVCIDKQSKKDNSNADCTIVNTAYLYTITTSRI